MQERAPACPCADVCVPNRSFCVCLPGNRCTAEASFGAGRASYAGIRQVHPALLVCETPAVRHLGSEIRDPGGCDLPSAAASGGGSIFCLSLRPCAPARHHVWPPGTARQSARPADATRDCWAVLTPQLRMEA